MRLFTPRYVLSSPTSSLSYKKCYKRGKRLGCHRVYSMLIPVEDEEPSAQGRCLIFHFQRLYTLSSLAGPHPAFSKPVAFTPAGTSHAHEFGDEDLCEELFCVCYKDLQGKGQRSLASVLGSFLVQCLFMI